MDPRVWFKPACVVDHSLPHVERVWFVVQAFAIQSYVTGEGPYANWSKHVADPFGYNLLTIVGNEDRLPTL